MAWPWRGVGAEGGWQMGEGAKRKMKNLEW